MNFIFYCCHKSSLVQLGGKLIACLKMFCSICFVYIAGLNNMSIVQNSTNLRNCAGLMTAFASSH